MTDLIWDNGTAYDFFISLVVLHYANEFGLRPSWAAGVRQRISAPRREFLEQLYSFSGASLEWVHSLAESRDASAALAAVASLDPGSRIPALTIPSEITAEVRLALAKIATRGSWTAAEKDFLRSNYTYRGRPIKPESLDNLLQIWAQAEESGLRLLDALQEYYIAFFSEEEMRILPALEAGLARARRLSEQMSLDALVEELSRGVRFEGLGSARQVLLVPSYWTAPLVFHIRPAPGEAMIVFGVRPDLESVAPGADTPDSLMNSLKALADPTRLRILRYLYDQPLTPSDLSRRLRLRPPTVIHHLQMLRLAGLVSILVTETGDKRYTARIETTGSIFNSLLEFLTKQE